MAEEINETATKSSEKLDLESLSGLDFGPNWADEKKTQRRSLKGNGKPRSGSGGKSSGGPRSAPRDRRGDARRESGGPQGNKSRFERNRKEGPPRSTFEPTVQINLYPQDEAFDALVRRLQATARTYQLFDIAKLLLEKPERYMVVVAPKNKKKDSEEASVLHYSVPGHLPFETEAEALSFVLNNHIELFFDIEETEAEPPAGNFQMVNRCGITGELLGPPNYHRYQEFAQRHYAAKISGMSFERFQSKIEGTKEQEDIDAWLESMKKRSHYRLKERSEAEPEAFDSFESARQFLVKNRKDQLVSSSESVRFAGRDLQLLPISDIKRSVEAYVEQQKHFPLDTANNIRGRLRRHKFAVYKKGSKGASFVCAVKRKFRDGNTNFTDSISDLVEFIEKHPNTPASKLPKLYIGIDTEKQKPEELKMTDAQIKQAEEKAKKGVEGTAEKAEDSDLDPQAAGMVTNSPQPPATASTDAQPKSELTKEEQAKLRQLMLDLRWLITEGYVTEYGDGKLFTPPPLPPAKKKSESETQLEAKSKTDPNSGPVPSSETEAPQKESAEKPIAYTSESESETNKLETEAAKAAESSETDKN